MAFSLQREQQLLAAIQADPLTCVRLGDWQYKRPDGAVMVYRDNVSEYLHRRLYRALVSPDLKRQYLIRWCETHGCVNPYHYRLSRNRIPLARTACPNQHPYTPETTTPSGHCRICADAHAERRRQRAAEGRAVPQPRTHCPHHHEFTPENTYEYPGKYGMYRKCRTCTAERNRARYAHEKRRRQERT